MFHAQRSALNTSMRKGDARWIWKRSNCRGLWKNWRLSFIPSSRSMSLASKSSCGTDFRFWNRPMQWKSSSKAFVNTRNKRFCIKCPALPAGFASQGESPRNRNIPFRMRLAARLSSRRVFWLREFTNATPSSNTVADRHHSSLFNNLHEISCVSHPHSVL